MQLQVINCDFSVCKLKNLADVQFEGEFLFFGKTDNEISLICATENVPQITTAREDGWKAFRINGELDFSLIGILARISTLLADNKIEILAVSTYNTDYIFVKKHNLELAIAVLAEAGYSILQ